MRRTKSETGKIIPGLVLALLVIFGCQSPFDLPKTADSATEKIPAGKGAISLSINGQGPRRTILPTATQDDFAKFVLTFTATTGGEDAEETWVGKGSGAVVLDVGNYNLIVKAYLTAEDASPTAQSDAIAVTVPASATVNVPLKPITNGNGTFKWTVLYPDDVVSAAIAIASEDGSGFTPQNINILTEGVDGDGELTAKTGTVALPTGCYRVTFTLTNSDDKTVEMQEIMYIYYNLESVFTQDFTDYFSTTLLEVILSAGQNEWDFDSIGIQAGHFGFLEIQGVDYSNLQTLSGHFNTLCTSPGEVPSDIDGLKALVDAALILSASNHNGTGISNAAQWENRDAAESAISALAVNGTTIDDFEWNVWNDSSGGSNYVVAHFSQYGYFPAVSFDGFIPEVVNWWKGLVEPYGLDGQPTNTTLARRYDGFQGKTDVLRVSPSPAYDLVVMAYNLDSYNNFTAGQTVTLNVSMDVWVDGWTGTKAQQAGEPPTITWLNNGNGNYSLVCGSWNEQLAAGQWHTLTGSITLTVPQGYTSVYLAGDHLGSTEVYIANFNVTTKVLPEGGTEVTGTWKGLTIPQYGVTALQYSSYQSKSDVLYVTPKGKYEYNVLTYDLSDHAGNPVTISVSMNVWVDDPATVVWQATYADTGGTHYPLVCGDFDTPLTAGQWNYLQGTVDITPSSNSMLIFSAQQFGEASAYIADFTVKVGSSSTFNISFGFEDIEAPYGTTMSILDTGTKTLTVSNPEQYTSIEWYIGSSNQPVSGAAITLTPSNFGGSTGQHFVRLEVIKGGTKYTKNITVTLTL